MGGKWNTAIYPIWLRAYQNFLSLHILKVSSCRSRSGGSKLRPVASLTITESRASGCFGQWEMISLLQNWEAVSRVVLQLRSTPCRGVQLEVQVQLDGISSSYYWASGCRASHGKPLAPSSGGRKQIVCSVGQSLLSSLQRVISTEFGKPNQNWAKVAHNAYETKDPDILCRLVMSN